MKLWFQREVVSIAENIEFSKIVGSYLEEGIDTGVLPLPKDWLEKYWVVVAEIPDANMFDVNWSEVEITDNIFEVVHQVLAPGDLVEKNGKFIMYATHVRNGIVDFGDVGEDYSYDMDSDEDLFDAEYDRDREFAEDAS